MSEAFAELLLLATVADGKIDIEEKKAIFYYLDACSQLSDFDRSTFASAQKSLAVKTHSGMSWRQIVRGFLPELSQQDRNTSYALILELLLSDKKLHHKEVSFLDEIAKELGVDENVIQGVNLSARLRYNKIWNSDRNV